MKLYAQGLARRLHEQRVGVATTPSTAPAARAGGRAGRTPTLHAAVAATAGRLLDRHIPTETDTSQQVGGRNGDGIGNGKCNGNGNGHESGQPSGEGNRQKLTSTDTRPQPAGNGRHHDDNGRRINPTGPSSPPAAPAQTAHTATNRQKLTPSDTRQRMLTNPGEAAMARSTFEPRIAHKVKPLTQAQLNAIDLLILGHSDSSAANHLGMHRTTLTSWRNNHPAFRAELARRRQEIWGSACEKFRQVLNQAVDEMQRQLEDEDKHVRFRAASRLLALSRHFRPPDEPTDVEGVLTQEARRINVEMYELHPAKSIVYEDDREEALQFLMRRAGEDFTVNGRGVPAKAEADGEATRDGSSLPVVPGASTPGCVPDPAGDGVVGVARELEEGDLRSAPVVHPQAVT